MDEKFQGNNDKRITKSEKNSPKKKKKKWKYFDSFLGECIDLTFCGSLRCQS
jgi:hypothetical protein